MIDSVRKWAIRGVATGGVATGGVATGGVEGSWIFEKKAKGEADVRIVVLGAAAMV